MIRLLAGLRIIEASAFIAAPLGGMLLSELGADVIRVDPVGGSVDRHRWPLTPSGSSLYWAGLNRAKRSVALDLHSDEGRDLLASLVTAPGENAGILFTNLPLGGPLAPAALRQLRPDVIVVRIAGDRRGHSQVDYTVNAAMGYPFVTGPADAVGPVNNVAPVWDISTASIATTALVGAVLRRFRTGEGALVELALEDVALAAVGFLGRLAAAQVESDPQPRDGNYIYGSFGRDFRTADGQWLMAVALTPRQWRALGAATGTTSELQSVGERLGAELDDEAQRYAARDEIAGILERALARMPAKEAEERLARAGAVWSRYRTFEQVTDEEVAARNPLLAVLTQPGVGTYFAPGSPVRVDGVTSYAGPAPGHGEHSRAVLREVLGLSDTALDVLAERGLIL